MAIEQLETRLLFSGPTASLDPQQAAPVAGAHTYAFTVDYTDAVAIDPSTLGNDDLTVTGPNNFSQPGQFLSEASGSGQTEASYSISFPGIGLTDFNNGAYTVTQAAYDPASTPASLTRAARGSQRGRSGRLPSISRLRPGCS